MPLLIVLSALLFNIWNAYINARFISHLGSYGEGWLMDPRFVAGAALFVAGWGINLRAGKGGVFRAALAFGLTDGAPDSQLIAGFAKAF